jgi:hypothetical protein
MNNVMLYGHSLSRCVRDIVKGRVPIDRIAVIITRTSIDNIETQFEELWTGYSRGLGAYWGDLDHDEVRKVVFELFGSGLIYQPRLQHAVARYPSAFDTVWTVPIHYDTEEKHISNPTVRNAWEEFLTVLRLSK